MSSDDLEPEQPTWRRPRRWPFALLGLAVLLVLALAWAGTYANAVWFGSVGYADVDSTLAVTKAGLFAATAILVTLVMTGSIVAASRRRPEEMPVGAWVERYRAYAEPVRLWIWICLTTIAALALGAAETGRWRDLLLWWQGGSFGSRDPWFHHDIGFYVFTLPWLHDVVDLGITVGLLAIATSVAAHYFYGGIAVAPAISWTRSAQRQLAIMAAITLTFKAGDYWLARYDTVHAGGPYATGVSYTDLHASLPGREILAYAALICAAFLLWQVRRPRWRMPVVAVILLFVSSVTLTLIWPAILQSSVVRPNPLAHERDNLAASIAATRTAYGLDHLRVAHLGGAASVAQDVPVLDPAQVSAEIQTTSGGAISTPELDRYVVGSKERSVWVAARRDGSTVDLVAAYADARNRVGKERPLTTSWAQNDVAHDLATTLAAPLYLGPDMPGGLDTSGRAPGVALTPLNRVAYALADGDLSLLGKHGTLALRLDPLQRVARIAPWLQLDRHPYLTVVGGRGLWVIDGYTTTGAYPGSSVGSWSGMIGDGSPGSSSAYDTVNYVRDAVKATVDAQDGSVRLYEWDADPILRAWEGIFPGLIRAKTEIPPELLTHLRYPTDLFAAQRFQAQTYATATPETLLGGQNSQIPTVGDGTTYASPERAVVGGAWSILSPMSTADGHDLAGVLVADSDATSSNYGALQWLTPSTSAAGPATINAIMRADPRVRTEIQSLPTSSTAHWGPLQISPSSTGITWIAPLYAISSDLTNPPILYDVVADVDGAVGVGRTVSEATADAEKGGPNQAPSAANLVNDANALLARSRDETLTPDQRDALVRRAQSELSAAATLLAASK